MIEPAKPSVPRQTRTIVLAAAALLAVGLLLRLAPVGGQGMWLDEIYGASYTNLSLFETIVACLRFDIHPPLYYLQLDLWSLFGHGDIWLMLNAVFWGMLSLVLVFLIAQRLSTRAALIALACAAVMGSEIYFANELRPYTMLGALMLLSWLFADRLRADYRYRAGIPLMLTLAVIGAIHSFGSIAATSALLYVFPGGSRQEIRRRLPTWIAVCATVTAAILPWMLNASIRHAGHMTPVTVDTLIYTLSGWPLGYDASDAGALTRAAVAALVILLVGVALRRIVPLRRMISCYLLWPVGFTAVVSFLWKPIWLFRPFAYCALLLAILFGAVADDLLSAARRRLSPFAFRATAGLTLATLLALGALSFEQSLAPVPWKTQYREAADYLRHHVKASDIVYAPQMGTFWSMARYLVGPEWGSMLKVEDPVDQDQSTNWPRIYARLGPGTLEWLHLKPQTRRVDGFLVPMYIGWTALPEVSKAASTWLVVAHEIGPPGSTLPGVKLPCPYKVLETIPFVDMLIYHIVCAAPDTRPQESPQAANGAGRAPASLAARRSGA